MRAPTLRRGAFFVAGAAWVLHVQPETVEVVATAGATAMRGGFRQLHRTGECTATAGMGQQRRLSEFTVGPLAPKTHVRAGALLLRLAVGSRNGRGSVGPIASAPFPMGPTGLPHAFRRGGPLAFLLASSRTHYRSTGARFQRLRFSVQVTLGHLSLRGKAGADFQSATGGQGRTGRRL